MMDILMGAGASLSQIDDGPQDEESANVKDSNDNKAADAPEANAPQGHRGLITAQKEPLRAFDTDLNNCPDLFRLSPSSPPSATDAVIFKDSRGLASKESDRGTAILNVPNPGWA